MPGQIQPNEQRGFALAQMAMQPSVKSVLEIGTWDGLGSTLCIGHAIRCRPDWQDIRFFSYEANKTMYNQATRNYPPQLPGRLMHGTLCSVGDMVELADYGDEYFTQYSRDVQENWRAENMVDIRNAPHVVVGDDFRIDLLVLDGGEYTTWSEYRLLKDRCRYIFADDTRCIKSAKVRDDIMQSGEWEYHDNYNDANGWIIAERKSDK